VLRAVRAVDGLDLRVEAGKFYGFLGPNGAGKSTTIKMLTGLLAPTSGTMRILDTDLAAADAARTVKRRIGVVPRTSPCSTTSRARVSHLHRPDVLLPPPTVRQRCQELLAMMELDREDKKVTLEYSHGMKKKLALAAALLPDPDLLFLDEPFEGVDAVASRMLRDTLRQFVKRGATVFLTSTCWRSWRSSVPTSASLPRAGWCCKRRWTRSANPARWRSVPGHRRRRPDRDAETELAGGLT